MGQCRYSLDHRVVPVVGVHEWGRLIYQCHWHRASRTHIFLTGSVAPSTQPDKLMKSTTHTIDLCPSRAALPSNTDLLLKCCWARSTSWFLKARKCSGACLPQPECLMCCHLGLGCPQSHHHDCECTQHSLC